MSVVDRPEGGPRLSQATLNLISTDVAKPAYDRGKLVPGIVHFGPGAFHRAHQAAYVDALLHHDPRWAISGVSLHSTAVAEALTPQDGLYTLALLDNEQRFRIVGSITELLTGEDDSRTSIRLASPDTRLITLTITEKGYCLGPDGALDPMHSDIVGATPDRKPRSAVEWIVRGLAMRKRAGVAGVTILSCDNLAANGKKLGNAVRSFAMMHDRDLANWIEDECRFPDSMVDSITPASERALRDLVEQKTGLRDAWPIQREAFVQWVIGDDFIGDRPALDSVGATFTSDVAGFEAAKLRLLNGAHSALAYIGLALGLNSVAEAMADAPLATFVERLMRDDIAPHVAAPPGLDVPAYIAAILERFLNPAVRHRLSQIAWDGSQKLPQRLLDTIAAALASGRTIDRLATPMAAWLKFIESHLDGAAEMIDPLAKKLIAAMRDGGPGAVLAMPEIFGGALRGNPRFETPVLDAFAAMPDRQGLRGLLH